MGNTSCNFAVPKKHPCGGGRGITATATVAPDPASGVLTVYVSSGSGYLYALNAATGAVTWKSVIHLPVGQTPNYYDWSSPTVANQKIYIGVSGSCTDHVRGALEAFSQATGKKLATYYTVPAGQVGGSIWATAAVATDGDVFVGTGNVLPPTPANEGTSESIVELNGANLAQLDVWQLPVADQPGDDDDFGASVSLFSAVLPGTSQPTPMVGACNKNGVYYALKQDDPLADYLLNSSTGAILATVSNGNSSQFAQPVFADQYLLIATESAGLYAYKP